MLMMNKHIKIFINAAFDIVRTAPIKILVIKKFVSASANRTRRTQIHFVYVMYVTFECPRRPLATNAFSVLSSQCSYIS